jgi:hypothetical protein
MNSSKDSIPSTIAIIMIVAVICLTVIAIKPGLLPPISKPTPTMVQPTLSSSSRYQPEVIPLTTDVPNSVQIAKILPTNTSVPPFTPTVLPVPLLQNQLLPDLTVTGISDPVCAPEYKGTKLRFSIFVRNIGRVSTRSFGPFDTGVYLILGQRHYGLGEWAAQFNGVIGSSVTEVFNLKPNEDIKFTVVVDLIGNKDFGIEVIANSGENPIPETDTTNNTLIKYYSIYCY